MSNITDIGWTQDMLTAINTAVAAEIMKIRTLQQVIPSDVLDGNPTEIADEEIDTDNLTIKEGATKPLVEIYREFSLTSAQVTKESTLNTCQTLATMTAKEIALAEDELIFQGKNAPATQEGKKLKATNKDSMKGLIHEARSSEILEVSKSDSGKKDGPVYGANVFTKVAEGIQVLTDNGQAGDFVLFLPTKVYADTYVPPADQSLVTTADRIKPLLLATKGFIGTRTLPDNKGLLIALGGDPITISVGEEANVEYVRQEGSKYFFRVVERVQYVVRDARSIVLLDFASDQQARDSSKKS